MESFENDRLTAALESLRPTPNAEFAARLDERAAAGFPRRPRDAASPSHRLAAWLDRVQPRRLLVPAGATALAAVAAVTVVVALGEGGSDQLNAERFGSAPTEAPQAATATPADGGYAGRSGAEAATPAKGASSASGASSLVTPGPRAIERSAEIVLGTEPADVAKDAARVFEAVHAQRGIVLRSSVRDGSAGEAGARFELLIPSARLGDALAAFSAIAEVRSRHEATADITAATVSASERLQDSRARIDGLLEQLSQADTEAERATVEDELRTERRHAASLRAELAKLRQRADLSRVSLRIETGDAGTSPGAGASGWGISDALDDAGHILAIAAGVTIVGLAIFAPIVLIALLAWIASRAWIRRGRERVLG